MKNESKYFLVLFFLFIFLSLIYFISAIDSSGDIVVERDGKISSTWGFDVGLPNETKPLIMNQPGKMTYNHNGNEKREYDGIGADGKFVFKDKKLKEAEFTTTKEAEYSFGNQKVKVPKGAHVIFKDNKVTIELPKDALIEKPSKIPNSKEEDVKVEYRYKQGEEPDKIKIKDNGKEYEIKKFGSNKFQVNYDGKVDALKVDGKFEMSGLRVGEYSKDDETYLFFDGKEHEIKGSYLSFGDKKLIVGASSKEFGSTVQFLSGNGIINVDDKKMMMIQAIGGERGGALTIENRDGQGMIPKVTANVGYNLFDGEKVLKYVDSYKDKYKGPILLTKNPINAAGKESVPLHIVTMDRGSRIGDWDVVVDSYGSIKAGNYLELESGGISLRQGLASSTKIGFNSLTPEEQAKISRLNPEKQRELAGLDVNKIREELKKTPELKIEQDSTKKYGNRLEDVRDLKRKLGVPSSGPMSGEFADPSVTVHESTHAINGRLSDGEYEGFYLFEGKSVKIKKINGMTFEDIRQYVPEQLKGSSSYKLYLIQQPKQQILNQNPLYIMDEFNAYVNDGIYNMESPGGSPTMNVPEFMTYSLAMGQAIQSKAPNYWNSANGQKLKEYMRYELERGMKINVAQTGSNEKASQKLNSMMDDKARNFAKDTFGADWVKNILGM